MSCEECEKAEEEGRVYWYRWKNANIGLIACQKHVKEVIDYLNMRCKDITPERIKRELLNKIQEEIFKVHEICDGFDESERKKGILLGLKRAKEIVEETFRELVENEKNRPPL